MPTKVFRLRAEIPMTTDLQVRQKYHKKYFTISVLCLYRIELKRWHIALTKHIFSADLRSSAIEVSISKGHVVIGSGDSTWCISVRCNQSQLTADVQSSQAVAVHGVQTWGFR